MKLIILLMFLILPNISIGSELELPKGIKMDYDDIDDITTYKNSKTSPYIKQDMWTPILMEVRTQKDGKPYIILQIRYKGQNWLFINQVKIIINGNQLDIELKDGNTYVDGAVNEEFRIVLTDTQINFFKDNLKDIESMKIRLYGKDSYTDIPKGMGVTEKALLKNAKEMKVMIDFFEILQNK